MIERLIEIVLNESKWLPAAMLLAFVAVGVLAARQRRQDLSSRIRILSGLHIFFGCMIGVMAFGHLLAVSVKVFQATLEGSPWLLYPLGLGLAVPAGWLVLCAVHLARDEARYGKIAVALNAWLGLFLLALGPQNLPLAAPAAINVGYHFHSRRAVGWTLVTVATAAYVALFVGSVMFFLSGQSFEQFQGME